MKKYGHALNEIEAFPPLLLESLKGLSITTAEELVSMSAVFREKSSMPLVLSSLKVDQDVFNLALACARGVFDEQTLLHLETPVEPRPGGVTLR